MKKILTLLPLTFIFLWSFTANASGHNVENDGLPIADHYKGGKDSLLVDLKELIVYPAMAKRNRIQGTCIIHVTMHEDGSFSDVKIIKDIGGTCGIAAKNAVIELQKSDKWIAPGYQANYQIPVKFAL